MAAVSAKGVVTVKGKGRAVITIKAAQTTSGKQAVKKITVTVK